PPFAAAQRRTVADHRLAVADLRADPFDHPAGDRPRDPADRVGVGPFLAVDQPETCVDEARNGPRLACVRADGDRHGQVPFAFVVSIGSLASDVSQASCAAWNASDPLFPAIGVGATDAPAASAADMAALNGPLLTNASASASPTLTDLPAATSSVIEAFSSSVIVAPSLLVIVIPPASARKIW